MDLMRDIPAPLASAFAWAFFYPTTLVYLDWPDGAVRAHSGHGTISWGGHVWTGVGQYGAVSVPEESASGVPVDFNLSLTCDLPELADYADAVVRQRPGVIYLGATQTRGGADLIGVVEIASGTMDTLVLRTEVEDGSDQVQILYTLSVGLTTGPGYRTAASVYHSHEDQVRQYPGDTAGKKLVLAQARAATTLWPEP